MRRSKKTSPLLPPAATSSFSSASDPATQYTYSRLTDSCITQLKAQGPSNTCNKSKVEEEPSTGVTQNQSHAIEDRHLRTVPREVIKDRP